MQSPQVEHPLSSLQGLGPSCDTTTPCNIHTRLLISGFLLNRSQLPHQLLFILKADFKCPLLRKDVLRCSQTGEAPLLSIPNAYFPAGLFSIETHRACSWGSLVAQLVKNPPAMRETWVHPWVGKIRWRRERLPTQYSGLENSMDYTVHGVPKSQTLLSDFHFHLMHP